MFSSKIGDFWPFCIFILSPLFPIQLSLLEAQRNCKIHFFKVLFSYLYTFVFLYCTYTLYFSYLLWSELQFAEAIIICWKLSGIAKTKFPTKQVAIKQYQRYLSFCFFFTRTEMKFAKLLCNCEIMFLRNYLFSFH